MTTQMKLAISVQDLERVGRVCAPFNGPARLEPGYYWIGDLGYALSDADWERSCESFEKARAVRLISGETALIFLTHGDGAHPASDGDSALGDLWVDSGTIGIVPMRSIAPNDDEDAPEDTLTEGIRTVFDEPFVCEADYERGVLTFGDIEIDLGISSHQMKG